MSACVARQCTGAAGRVENCQVGVFAAYVSPARERALIDRELYLPEKWTADRDPGPRALATTRLDQPELAGAMIERAVKVGSAVLLGGRQRGLRRQPEAPRLARGAEDFARHGRGLQRDHRDGGRGDAGGRCGRPGSEGRLAAAELRRRLQGAPAPRLGAHRRRGPGASPARAPVLAPGEKGQLELAYFRCWSPPRSPCPSSSPWLGRAGDVEDCFAEAKGEAGLNHYQVRKYRAWYRHATLSMLAHAFLAVAARASRPGMQPPASGNGRAAPAEKGT